MKLKVILAATAALSPTLLAAAGAPPPAPQALLLRQVHVVPMTDQRVLRDVSVLIRDGRIAAIGEAGALPAPPGARVIEGGGRYLLPGLVEMHIHLRDEMSLDLLLGHGVTTARNMDGTPQVLAWRSAIAEGRQRGPRLFSGSPFLHRAAADAPDRFVGSVDDAIRQARRYAGEGYDFIKIAELDDAPFFALMAEARRLGIPVAGHIPNYELDLGRILGERMASVEHLEELFRVYFHYQADAAKIPAFVELVRRSGVPISTLIGRERLLNGLADEGDAYLTPERRAWVERYSGPQGIERVLGAIASLRSGAWERQRVDIAFLLRLVRELEAAGVVIVPGTDSGGSFTVAGFGLHEELELLSEAGLSPWAILRTVTVNPARVLGAAARRGTVEVGKDADLVLVEDDPLSGLATLREPVGLVLHGSWIDRDELRRLRARRWQPPGAAAD